MKRTFFALALATVVSACSPAAPSVVDTSHDYHPPVFPAGACILGTTPDCATVIPLPKAPVPEPTKPSMTVDMACGLDKDTHLSLTCRFSARNELGQIWTVHIVSQDFDWGDGSPIDHNEGLLMSHTYRTRESFGFGGFVYDDRGVRSYTSGSVSTVAPSEK